MRSLLVPAVALLGVFAFACSPSTTGSGVGPGGGATTADGGAGATGAKPLSCSGIFDCAGACADDKACEDNCLAQGSPASQDAANGLVKCATDNACADADCFKTNCEAELQACASSSSASGETFDGTAPAGNVPAELVGKWHSPDEVYEFRADGTASYYTQSKTSGCLTTSLENGTAVANGDSLTIYFTSRVHKVCDTQGDEPYTPKSVPFKFRVDPATETLKPILRLQELNCRYSDPAAAEMYCRVGYDKE
ncbi:MAG: hypothetical protein JWP87_5901 [Labilithrix sp.]|nr:hypothetical protein [Labilithrix sp.]